MQLNTIDQILLQLCLEVGSKVNHDLLGSMHVVNFCAEEMSADLLELQSERLLDYGNKLRHSTGQMAETIRLSRTVVNTLKGMLVDSEQRQLSLSESLNFAYSLSQLFHRHLPSLNLEVKTSRRMRSVVLAVEEVFALVPIFDWLASYNVMAEEKIMPVLFEEAEDSQLLLFSTPIGALQIDSLSCDFLHTQHPFLKYLEFLGKQNFVEKIIQDRDIIGLLRSKEGRDYYYLHLNLFQREFQATLT